MDFKKLTIFLDQLESSYGIPSTDCKITKDHLTIYRHQTGYADYEKKRPVSNQDLYGLYSATKLITMVAVLQLIENKKIGLDDELRLYLPEYANMRVADHFELKLPLQFPIPWPDSSSPSHQAKQQIRIVDLMSMTSGMSYNLSADPIIEVKKASHNLATTRDVVAAMAKMPLLYEPRSKWSYSLSHDVLAAVVEVVSGERFSDYLNKHVFLPLGITDFYFSINQENKQRLSAHYVHDGGTGRSNPVPYDDASAFIRITDNYESGGAGLIGSVDAYSAVIDALCDNGFGANGGRILQKESVSLFSKNFLDANMLADFQTAGGEARKGYGYGFGVRVHMDASTAISPVGEFGWDGAAGAYALVDPINHISIFYAQHVTGLPQSFSKIHPIIRDLAYEAVGFAR